MIDEHDHEIFDSSKILTQQRQFYKDFYSSKESLPVKNLKYSDMLTNLPKRVSYRGNYEMI